MVEELGQPAFFGNKCEVEHKSTGQIVKLSYRRKPHNEEEDKGEDYVFDFLVKEAYSLAFRRSNLLLGLLQVGEGMAAIEARKRSPVDRY